MTSESLRVVVLGYVVRGPLGALAWHHLQYVLGLDELGHDVWFLEDSEDYPSCYDPVRDVTSTDATYGLRFAHEIFSRVGMGDRWAYYDAHDQGWVGPAAKRVPEVCASADLLIDVSGVNPLRRWLEDVPVRVLIDTDPVFTQIQHLTDADARARARAHTAFFSFAHNVAAGTAALPDDGLPWRATRQPVSLNAWPVTAGPPNGPYTTVMNWASYPPREHGGRRYGVKAESFAAYRELPSHVDAALEIALGGPNQPRDDLRAAGWKIRDARVPTRDPFSYQAYVRASKGELSVAKHGYVVSNSGWFSERTAGYLASGRPAIVQDTGFTEWIEGGLGVVPFTSLDEAVAAIEDVDARYDEHCRAARELVAERFDARRVIGRLIADAIP